jgi:hypothetical protein
MTGPGSHLDHTGDTMNASPVKARPAVDSVIELPEGTQEFCDVDGPAVTAAVLVTLTNGGQLTLCGHHAHSNGFASTVITVPDVADML